MQLSHNAWLGCWLILLLLLAGCNSDRGNAIKNTSTVASGSAAATSAAPLEPIELLNVSYDPTRELYQAINAAFEMDYEQTTGQKVSVKQSHGGSTSQARAVVDGLEADVVTLALWSDIDVIRKQGLIAEGWEDRLPNRSLPYFSTIVFVVRKGNPKNILDWPDVVKDGVEIITPNPKTGGGAKLSFLAAWGSVIVRGGSEDDAKALVTKLYRQVPVLDTGARGSTTTFSQKKIGDVHLTWENEAHLEVAEAAGELEIVYPPISIRAEPHVAVVDQVVERHGSRAAAEAYLQFLYTDTAQEIIASRHYRTSNEEVWKRHAQEFPELQLFPITAIAQSWDDAFERFFGDGGVYDNIYSEQAR